MTDNKEILESKVKVALSGFSILDKLFPELDEFLEKCNNISKHLEEGESIDFCFDTCSKGADSIVYPILTAILNLKNVNHIEILTYEPMDYTSGINVIYPEKFNAKSYVEFLRSLNKH